MNNSTEYQTKTKLNYLVVAIVTGAYASSLWLGKLQLDQWMVSFDIQKPFVYRQLLPILIRFLDWVMPLDWAIVLLVALSGVGFYYALHKLVGVFFLKYAEIYLLVSVLAGLLLFNKYFAIYDLATVFLFTLAFYYLATKQDIKYLILFPLICLNRETAILLTVFCVVLSIKHKINDVDFIGYQVFVWLASQVFLRWIFADNAGAGLWIEPLENIQKFIADPMQTLLHLSVMVVILFLVFRNWKSKPLFLRLAFMTFAPLLFVAYIIMGQAFEVRVFWEIYSVVVLLVMKQ